METTGVAFSIGAFSVDWYGILITLGVIAATVVAAMEAKRRGQSVDHLLNMLLLILPLGIIGARAYHVIDQWSYYAQHPNLIVGGRGLGIYGAVIGGALGILIYTKWKKLGTLRWMDIIAPGVLLAQAIGRWGNYFNQELYGYPTKLPWGIYIAPQNRLPGYGSFTHFQPLFFYEFIWDLAGFAFIMFIARKYGNRLLRGEVFLLYLVTYGIGRFILEGMKINVWTIAGIPTARWEAGGGIVIVIAITVFRRMRISRRAKAAAEPRSPEHADT